MLVLAVRTDAERVYARALVWFTPDEIAEAFAAAHGIASPTQLRNVMKRDGRDLVTQFRALAPARRPIPLQRWNVARVALAVAVLLVTVVVVQLGYRMFIPADLPIVDQPGCSNDDVMVLMAQAVPTAGAVPCIVAVPTGWRADMVRVQNGRAWFELETTGHVVEVTLLPPGGCDVAGADEVASDELDMRRYERPTQLPPDLRTTRTYVGTGGCVTYEYRFDNDTDGASLMIALDPVLEFRPRRELVDEVADETGLRLCGADAPPCPGGSP